MVLLRLVFLVLVSPFLLIARVLGIGRAPILHLPQDHPEMAVAIARARESLPSFRRLLAAPESGMDNFGIKARFEVPGGAEHCWIMDLTEVGADFVGKISVEPDVPDLEYGSEVTVTEDMVTDWAYSQNGVYHGHYTTKALIPHMSRRLRRQVLQIYGWSAEDVS